MRFLTLCAIALFSGLYLWTFTAPVEAQRGVSISKNPSGTSTDIIRSKRSSGISASHPGNAHRGHSHPGHSHHPSHGFGQSHSHGHLFPYSSSYYSSYSNYYTPFGGSFFHGTVSPGYGCYNSTWGYPSGIYSAPAYQYIPTPVVVPHYPAFTQPLIDAQADAEARWTEALRLGSHIRIPIKSVIASSTQEKIRSQRLQISGDQLFRKQFFSQAMKQYREANSVAQDLPGPYFRMSVIYAIQGKFDASVTYLKRTLELDPTWPTNGYTLTMLYGENNSLARNALLIEVSRWVEEDIRDPDRSFLMGAFLYEFDREKAATFLETSARLSGSTYYVTPYLSPASTEVDDAQAPDPVPTLPEGEIPNPPSPQPDPTLKQNRPAAQPQINPLPPPNLGFSTPRRGEIVTPLYKASPKGPNLPSLGN